MSFVIRPIEKTDEPFLQEMLYHALFVSEGHPPFPKEIVYEPHLAKYVDGWGKEDDRGFIAFDESTSKSVGAVWVRLFAKLDKGYGFISDDIPELSIALLPEYRNRGLGHKLLEKLIDHLDGAYPAISLSVSVDNPAVRLYERLGFEVIERQGNSLTMKKDLRSM
jgi:ribosomal protein S18 acetylase RimI-like enzyme